MVCVKLFICNIFVYLYIFIYIYSKKKVYLRENGVEFLLKNFMFLMYWYEFCINKFVLIFFLFDLI